MTARKPIEFTHNGTEAAVFVEPASNLLDVLRRSVGDLSPKYGCGQGTCGSCSVIINGELRLACLTLAETVAGAEVETAGGLASEHLHPLQQCFMDNFAAQCGYCTPGMLVAAKALLDKNSRPTREDVVEAIGGNICRCTGYEAIIQSVLDASGSGASLSRSAGRS